MTQLASNVSVEGSSVSLSFHSSCLNFKLKNDVRYNSTQTNDLYLSRRFRASFNFVTKFWQVFCKLCFSITHLSNWFCKPVRSVSNCTRSSSPTSLSSSSPGKSAETVVGGKLKSIGISFCKAIRESDTLRKT